MKIRSIYFNFFQPPICDAQGQNLLKKRRKRQTLELDETQGLLYDTDREDLKVKVYRGLYVSEANDLDDAFIDEDVPTEVVSTTFCYKRKSNKCQSSRYSVFTKFQYYSNIMFFFSVPMIQVPFAFLNETLPLE